MNITKEQIKEWVEDYDCGMSGDCLVDAIHHCIQDLGPKDCEISQFGKDWVKGKILWEGRDKIVFVRDGFKTDYMEEIYFKQDIRIKH